MPAFLFVLLLARTVGGDPATLHVTVRHIQVGKGTINVAVFNNKKDFLHTPVAAQSRRADAETMEFSFDLAPGDVAVAVYQDLNGNGKLDAGIFNIPKEPYGFSNNYRPSFSAPHYEGCLIRVSGQTASTINLK